MLNFVVTSSEMLMLLSMFHSIIVFNGFLQIQLQFTHFFLYFCLYIHLSLFLSLCMSVCGVQASQHRAGVSRPAGSDFILLQGQQGPDPQVFRPGQRVHEVHRCCQEGEFFCCCLFVLFFFKSGEREIERGCV